MEKLFCPNCNTPAQQGWCTECGECTEPTPPRPKKKKQKLIKMAQEEKKKGWRDEWSANIALQNIIVAILEEEEPPE